MRVVLISASHHPKTRTSQAVRALLAGIRTGGGQAKHIVLSKLKIQRCRHCEDLGKPCGEQGRCSLDDDFDWVVQQIRQADVVVFVSPVYPAGPAAGLRAFLHRLGQVCKHRQTRDSLSGTTAVGVCIGGGASNCAERLRAALTGCGIDVLEIICGPRQDLHLNLAALEAAGRRLAAKPAGPPSSAAAVE